MTLMPDETVNILKQLRREVEEHLAWRKAGGKEIKATTFGVYAVANRHFYARLKDGREFQSSTIRAVRKFIKDDRAEIERRAKRK